VSTAHDQLRLIEVELDAASGGSLPLRHAMKLTQEPQLDRTGNNVSLGWTIDGTGRYWHNGSTGGCHAFVGFDPKTKRGVVLLASTATSAIDRLPDGFREVFMLRVVEHMSVEETAITLGILVQTVKSRLHRAKAMLRSDLEEHLTAVSLTAFPFGGARCRGVTEAVLARLNLPTTTLHH